ncbi:MAG: shikimate kinase [Tabrizicola sp.]|uniref:shikimate kinase n=1 Tax=Tabrizicola sp. TaxID=2005166 RepID=UPI003BAE7180
MRGNEFPSASPCPKVTKRRAMARLAKTVVLVGMMGAGKTAVGTALARQLGVEFRDSDEEIVRAANRTIAEIFERDGEPFFRARESEVIGRLLRGTPCVLSTGGGAFLAATNRSLIHDVGVSVWLKADLELLWQRVRHKTTRPLLRTPNPRETLRELYERRQPLYAQADIVVESAAERSIEEMASRVVEALKARPDVLEV